MILPKRLSFSLTALAFMVGAAFSFHSPSSWSVDLGVEGQIFEPIEEDFRLALLRLVAKKDWTDQLDNLKTSAKNYTKNLPDFYIPLAEETKTHWKDVGIVTTEDIFLPSVDWETGSVFEPDQALAVPAGTYLNPIAQMPSAAIERLFIFDATSPEQLAIAKDLISLNIPMLNFLIVAGDLSPISEEANRPIYHLTVDMIDRFQIKAVPTLIGFGKGSHLGHMASTQFKLPMEPSDIEAAWFGLPYVGYDPLNALDVELTDQQMSEIRGSFSRAAEVLRKKRQESPPGVGSGMNH